MGGRRGGAMKSRAIVDRLLCRHIESATKKKTYATVEQLVDHLRSTYPKYARNKLQPFTKRVQQIIQISSSRNDIFDYSHDDDDTPIRKKRRSVEEREEQLRHMEANHVRSSKGDVLNDSNGSSSSLASAASTCSSSEEDESSEEEVSTSEDAIYGKKFEPEFDLMTSMLRENYCRKSKELREGMEVEEAVELEVVDNKVDKNVISVAEGGRVMDERGRGRGCDGYRQTNADENGNRDGIEYNGPKFKDLGGLSGVIEELKMEVIVPLYSPQLPRHLGVKPMAGIPYTPAPWL